MTEFKVGDRVTRRWVGGYSEPGTVAGVLGDGHHAWQWSVVGEEYLVRLDSKPGPDVYYARPEDLERI